MHHDPGHPQPGLPEHASSVPPISSEVTDVAINTHEQASNPDDGLVTVWPATPPHPGYAIPAPPARYTVEESDSLDDPTAPTTFFVIDSEIDDAVCFFDDREEAEGHVAALNAGLIAPTALDEDEDIPFDVRSCRVCGCTDDEACDGGCWWVADPEGGDLCSACVGGAA